MPDNYEAARIYNLVRRQVITMGEAHEPIDLNQLAVWKLIDEYHVKDRVGCFEKVNRLFQVTLAESRKNR